MAGGLLYDVNLLIADAQDPVCLCSSEGPKRESLRPPVGPRFAERAKSK